MQLAGYSGFRKIGEGGMAQVYRATQDSLQRPVAIKLLNQDIGLGAEASRRFDRESTIIARLNHPNIVKVIDRGISGDERPYFVMEFVDGQDLHEAGASDKLSHQQRMDIVVQLLKALAYAHKHDVIHRDIKPDNILIDSEGVVKVLDFGIAQICGNSLAEAGMTRAGTVMGTYDYMSPEQQRSSDRVTARSDIYSVGVIMYGLFAGTLPSGDFRPPIALNNRLSPALNQIIMQCLSTDPWARPESAQQLQHVLLDISLGRQPNLQRSHSVLPGGTEMKSRFQLLDILRDDELGGAYLCQHRLTGKLLIVKKRPLKSTGYAESRQLSNLKHDNIVRVLGTFRNDQFFFVAQEYVGGDTLRERLSSGLSWAESLRISRQVCAAILHAHCKHIVHGRLHPKKIRFDSTGQVKVVDFALDCAGAGVGREADYYPAESSDRKSADIYAIGGLLCQLLTGKRSSRNPSSSCTQLQKLPASLREAINNMLSLRPEQRDSRCLYRAIGSFQAHLLARGQRAFTAMVRRDTTLQNNSPQGEPQPPDQLALAPRKLGNSQQDRRLRLNVLFAVLMLLYAQYLFLFDGQENISRSMPTASSAVLDEFALNLGRSDARGSNRTEDGRRY